MPASPEPCQDDDLTEVRRLLSEHLVAGHALPGRQRSHLRAVLRTLDSLSQKKAT